MEKKRISNFEILSFAIIISVIIIIIGSINKVINNHNEASLYAMQSKVEYYAKRCYLENNCTEVMTLKELYEKNYITETIVNPNTKEIISDDLEIKYIDGNIIINWN